MGIVILVKFQLRNVYKMCWKTRLQRSQRQSLRTNPKAVRQFKFRFKSFILFPKFSNSSFYRVQSPHKNPHISLFTQTFRSISTQKTQKFIKIQNGPSRFVKRRMRFKIAFHRRPPKKSRFTKTHSLSHPDQICCNLFSFFVRNVLFALMDLVSGDATRLRNLTIFGRRNLNNFSLRFVNDFWVGVDFGLRIHVTKLSAVFKAFEVRLEFVLS